MAHPTRFVRVASTFGGWRWLRVESVCRLLRLAIDAQRTRLAYSKSSDGVRSTDFRYERLRQPIRLLSKLRVSLLTLRLRGNYR